jgi:hypothetical protein
VLPLQTDDARRRRIPGRWRYHDIGQITVRREVSLGSAFSREEFERGFEGFRALYNVVPVRAACAPDVLAHFCELYEPKGALAHAHSLRLQYLGVAIVAAVLAPGTIIFEGEVDDVRMGDW